MVPVRPSPSDEDLDVFHQAEASNSEAHTAGLDAPGMASRYVAVDPSIFKLGTAPKQHSGQVRQKRGSDQHNPHHRGHKKHRKSSSSRHKRRRSTTRSSSGASSRSDASSAESDTDHDDDDMEVDSDSEVSKDDVRKVSWLSKP